MQQQQQDSFQVKVVLLGRAWVGKSSLVLRFVQDKFYTTTEGTIGGIIRKKKKKKTINQSKIQRKNLH